MDIKVDDRDLPGLYQIANGSSNSEQNKYFIALASYLILLFVAAIYASYDHDYPNPIYKITSAILFFATLAIIIWMRIIKPEANWYNGRAVAESVKTRAWRWMMKAEPYDSSNAEDMRKHFVHDLKEILKQNESLIAKFSISASVDDPISEKMLQVRSLPMSDRITVYRRERITNQALWYTTKVKRNKKSASFCFGLSVVLHALAIFLLLYNIMESEMILHIEVIAVAATSVLSWLEAKKHNELSSSYALAVHDITLIKSDTSIFNTEAEFSIFVLNCENAFSREHTQWFARKKE